MVSIMCPGFQYCARVEIRAWQACNLVTINEAVQMPQACKLLSYLGLFYRGCENQASAESVSRSTQVSFFYSDSADSVEGGEIEGSLWWNECSSHSCGSQYSYCVSDLRGCSQCY